MIFYRIALFTALLVFLAVGASRPRAQMAMAIPTVVQAQSSTVANLPACNASTVGQLYLVTDALLPTALANVNGGGAVKVPVICTGVAYVVG